MSGLSSQHIRLGNSSNAVAVLPAANNTAKEIAGALSLVSPKAIILIIGGAADLDASNIPLLTQLYSRGIAKAVLETEAMVVSGGTQAGVMSLIGEGIASRGKPATLLGIAPASLVSYEGGEYSNGTPLEPNHTHFVLTQGTAWGDETATLFSLVKELATDAAEGKDPRPTLAIVAGGGDVTRTETLKAVRQNIPLLFIEGSGGFADEICSLLKDDAGTVTDPVLAEIKADGNLRTYPLTGAVSGLERLVVRELGTNKVLLQSWETFAAYDFNASIQQKRFDWIQLSVIGLGFLGTLLVVVQQIWAPRDAQHEIISPATGRWLIVHHTLILIPILLTALITAASRFKQGSKWLLLRAGAESIKREIYRYRTRSLGYETKPEQVLAQRVEDITRRTMRTEVNLSALRPFDKTKGFPPHMGNQQKDDGFSYLSPDNYVAIRLTEQIAFYTRKSVFHEKRLRRILWLTYIVGGLGTYLAAINAQAWIALTTAIVSSLGTYLAYRQTEHTLTKYNQTATDLTNVKAWWESLAPEEQTQQANINSLVDHTEQVLQSELDGWIQQMQNALAELRKGQEAAAAQAQKKGSLAEEGEPSSSTRQTRMIVVSKQKKEETVVAVKETTNAEITKTAEATSVETPTAESGAVPTDEFPADEEAEPVLQEKPSGEKLFQ